MGLTLIGALLWGLGAARQLGVTTLWLRGLLAPGLGVAGLLALWTVIGEPTAVGVVLALAGIVALIWEAPEEPRLKLRPGGLFPLFILSLAAWFYPVGVGQLEPDAGFLVELAPWVAAGGSHFPLGPAAAPQGPLAILLLALGGDAFLWDRALAGTFGVLALLTAYGLFRQASGQWLAAFLGAGFLFCWGESGWLLTTSSSAAAGHLLLAAGLGARVVSRTPFGRVHAWLITAAAVAFSPAAGLAAGFALTALEVFRERRLTITPLVLFSMVGVALNPEVVPALPAPTLWLVLLIPVAWWNRRQDAVLLWALAEPLSWLFGGALAPGTAAATALGFAVGHSLAEAWQAVDPARPGLMLRGGMTLRLPWRYLLAALGLLMVVLGMEPGESVFNHRLLLPAQKRKVDLLDLAAVRSLKDWVPLMGQRLELSLDDLELAEYLRGVEGTTVVLTPGARVEPVVAAGVLSALAGGRALAGWHADPDAAELFPAPALIRRTGDLRLVAPAGIRLLVLRGPADWELPPEARVALQTAVGSRLIEFPPVPPLNGSAGEHEPIGPLAPGHLTEFSGSEGLEYTVTRDGQPWGADLPVRDSRFILPRTPGSYRLTWSGLPPGEPVVSDLYGSLGRLRASAVGIPPKLPSRSLVPVRILLTNPGPGNIDLGLFRARLRAFIPRSGAEVSFEAPLEALPRQVLGEGRSVELHLTLSTPEPEGNCPVKFELMDLRGRIHNVSWDPPLVVRTWRRLPPVGTW